MESATILIPSHVQFNFPASRVVDVLWTCWNAGLRHEMAAQTTTAAKCCSNKNKRLSQPGVKKQQNVIYKRPKRYIRIEFIFILYRYGFFILYRWNTFNSVTNHFRVFPLTRPASFYNELFFFSLSMVVVDTGLVFDFPLRRKNVSVPLSRSGLTTSLRHLGFNFELRRRGRCRDRNRDRDRRIEREKANTV